MDPDNRDSFPAATTNGIPVSRGGRLDRALARTSGAPLRVGNRLALLKNGPNTYDDWLAAISRAERWVHLDNYIFQDDTTGQRFAEALSNLEPRRDSDHPESGPMSSRTKEVG